MLRSETCSLFCRERCKTRDKPLILPWITDEFHVNRICCVEKSKPFNMISRELRLCYEYVTDLRERNSQTMLYFSMRWGKKWESRLIQDTYISANILAGVARKGKCIFCYSFAFHCDSSLFGRYWNHHYHVFPPFYNAH